MAAFDRVKSGIPMMDTALDNIRLGDNVVWQVSSLDEYRIFAGAFVNQSVKDGHIIHYIRFAHHEPLFREEEGIVIHEVELSHRFETFTMEIHNIIEKEGYDALYVFDSLSDLQTAWATDMMMGNFFRVTCPYLFSLDTVAFFPLIRGRHSFAATAKIKDTTQLFLDVHSDEETVYVRPQKVWERYSETMFLPHIYNRETGDFAPVLDGVSGSRYYSLINAGRSLERPVSIDSWDRFFDDTVRKYEEGKDVSAECGRICDIMITRDEKLRTLVRKHFRTRDYLEVRERMVGSGMIGGKACGMLLSRKIIENTRPDIFARMEPHDSFYVGSDVFYTYIVDNGFWDIRVRQRREKEYFSLAGEFAEKLRSGRFSNTIREQFIALIEYYGSDPYIVRSSSILEDGFGNAFAGKYESVFCANAGTVEERIEELENACRIVYASTMSLSALDYRKRRGLEKRDEQMALLIQRVSGSRYGHYFMPCAAGVGYSYSPYRFLKELNPAAGMLRLVGGLGTSAVDRTEGSYPRLVSLDAPEATSARDVGERHKFSQRCIEMVDTKNRSLGHTDIYEVEKLFPPYIKNLLFEHDYDVESRLREMGQWRQVVFLSCRGLVQKKELMEDLRLILKSIQDEYACPVDTEFTINVSRDGEYVINLLQCRPLQVLSEETSGKNVKDGIPEDISNENIFLSCVGASMGFSRNEDIHIICYVDPIRYYNMPYNEKNRVAKAIGEINWHFRGSGKNMVLISPGRIGTTSPELGVPAVFSDISEFMMIVEVAESKAGYRPELSYGSHFFQDLVEEDILYCAVFESRQYTKCWRPELLKGENRIREICGENAEGLEDIIGLYIPEKPARLYFDMAANRLVAALQGE